MRNLLVDCKNVSTGEFGNYKESEGWVVFLFLFFFQVSQNSNVERVSILLYVSKIEVLQIVLFLAFK